MTRLLLSALAALTMIAVSAPAAARHHGDGMHRHYMHRHMMMHRHHMMMRHHRHWRRHHVMR